MTSETQNGSRPRPVAVRLVELVRASWRVVRDEETGAYFALADNASPLPLAAALENAVQRLYATEDRVASRDAVKNAERVLHDAPTEQVYVPPAEPTPEQRAQEAEELFADCKELAETDDLLHLFHRELRRDSFVGDTTLPRLIYLAVAGTTILHPSTCQRPVSVAISGVSAAGKNYAAEAALAYLPDDLWFLTSGMSPTALIYDVRDLRNAFLYVPEGATLVADSRAAVLLRTLISEGRLIYPVTVTRDNEAPVTEIIEREGPTALLLTSSAITLDQDLVTRMLCLHVSDDPNLTGRIMRRIAATFQRGGIPERDRSQWQALYKWHRLAGPHKVRVPFARSVARRIPAAAVRLRRDATVLWVLTCGHAALHRLNREVDASGAIVATWDDYEAVRQLLEPVLAASAGTQLPQWMTETWEQLPATADKAEGITYAELGRRLELGRDAARDRARRMIDLGLAVDLADDRPDGRRRSALARGDDPSQSAQGLLPTREEIDSIFEDRES